MLRRSKEQASDLPYQDQIVDVSRFDAVVYDRIRHPWREIRGDVLEIQQEGFGRRGSISEDDLQTEFEHSSVTGVLLSDSHEVAGFALAAPIGYHQPHREVENVHTAYVARAAIRARYRKQGLLPKMLGTLTEELVQRGYRYAELHARVRNGFADTLRKVYKEQIVFTSWSYDIGAREPVRRIMVRLQ